jgi:methylated-DNA-[protein]-cysteine S-methyltransferase
MNQQFTATTESPIGIVRVTAVERGITDVTFCEKSEEVSADAPTFLLDCITQLREYFEGKRSTFDSLPLAVSGTDFQQKVWDITETIPYGETITYGDISKELRMNGGGQAVGSAMGRNPVCIIVPCHRVVPSSPAGTVGGYAGGAWRKEWLLNLEKKISNAQ